MAAGFSSRPWQLEWRPQQYQLGGYLKSIHQPEHLTPPFTGCTFQRQALLLPQPSEPHAVVINRFIGHGMARGTYHNGPAWITALLLILGFRSGAMLICHESSRTRMDSLPAMQSSLTSGIRSPGWPLASSTTSMTASLFSMRPREKWVISTSQPQIFVALWWPT